MFEFEFHLNQLITTVKKKEKKTHTVPFGKILKVNEKLM
jgi:hypothetical protein